MKKRNVCGRSKLSGVLYSNSSFGKRKIGPIHLIRGGIFGKPSIVKQNLIKTCA